MDLSFLEKDEISSLVGLILPFICFVLVSSYFFNVTDISRMVRNFPGEKADQFIVLILQYCGWLYHGKIDKEIIALSKLVWFLT